MKALSKLMALLCTLAMVTAMLAACGGTTDSGGGTEPAEEPASTALAEEPDDTEPEPASGDEVELSFWTWRVEDIDFYDNVIAEFEAANPGIKVVQNAIKNTDYNTTLSAALAGEGGPDVFMTRCYGGLQTFADSGYLLALDGLLPELDGFSDETIAGATSPTDGKVYGVPAVAQTMLCFYNTKVYDELGLSIPTTWDEFLSNLAACQDAGYIALGNGTKEGWICEVMMGAASATWYGGNDFYDKVVAGETNFEDPVYVAAVDKLNELIPYLPDQYEGVDYTDMQSWFANEMSAHIMSGSYEAGTFLSLNPDAEFDVFAVPGATASDTAYVSVYADMNYSINAATDKEDAALKLLAWLATPEFGEKVVNELQMMTSIPGVDFSGNDFLGRVLELQEAGSTPYMFLVGFRYEQPTGSSLFQAAAQGMFTGELTAAEVCAEVQEGVATYYEPFQ